MSDLYAPEHRALQEKFGTTRLANLLENVIVHDEVAPEEQAFIESRDMFFLSTVDPNGHPTVSYKGGAPGFVRVVDPRTLVFPCYDGNGMFYSMGNIAGSAKIGMLFIDFEKPHRLRLQGEASLHEDDPLVGEFPGATMMVRVRPKQIFVNCPRYIHRYRKAEQSKYVPDADGNAPVPGWKRIDVVQDHLPEAEKARVAAAGDPLTVESYQERMAKGEI